MVYEITTKDPNGIFILQEENPAYGFDKGKPYPLTSGRLTSMIKSDIHYPYAKVPKFTLYTHPLYPWSQERKQFVGGPYKVPSGFYHSPEALLEKINETCHRNVLSYNSHINRFEVTTSIGMFGNLHQLLGFRTKTVDRGTIAAHPPLLHRGIYSLYVYSNVCEYSLVGDTQVPLLRSVPLKSSTKFGDVESTVFMNPMYIPVNKTFIDNIEIDIRDDAGEEIPFEEGRTVVVLHFRHKQ